MCVCVMVAIVYVTYVCVAIMYVTYVCVCYAGVYVVMLACMYSISCFLPRAPFLM